MRSLLLVSALLLAVGSTGCTIVRTHGFDAAEPSVYATPPPAVRYEGIEEASENDEEAPAFFVGEHLLVEWHGSYWPAVVLSTHGEVARIHYDGYGPEWDEAVGPERTKRLVPAG